MGFLYNTDLFGTELKKKCKMFHPMAWCILVYCKKYILKAIKILLNFVHKDQKGIRKERLICFIANEKSVSKPEKIS